LTSKPYVTIKIKVNSKNSHHGKGKEEKSNRQQNRSHHSFRSKLPEAGGENLGSERALKNYFWGRGGGVSRGRKVWVFDKRGVKMLGTVPLQRSTPEHRGRLKVKLLQKNQKRRVRETVIFFAHRQGKRIGQSQARNATKKRE